MTTTTVGANAAKQILIIEDDPLIADVYRDKLNSEGFTVSVAGDGRAGLAQSEDRKPDLVLLDLMLPEVNGVDVLKVLRARWSPRELPVLVFTNAYLGGFVQQAWEAGANQVLTKATLTSKLLVGMVRNALDNPPPAAITQAEVSSTAKTTAKFDPAVRRKFLAAAPESLAALWQPVKALAARPKNIAPLQEFYTKIRPFSAAAALAGLEPIAQMSAAMEALVKDVCEKPGRLTPSVLLTLAQGIDTMKFLFAHPESARKDPATAEILVVDDDEFTRQAVTRSLARVNLKPICVDSPVSALKRRVGAHFDLIFLDIEMPEATGFDLCTRLRIMPQYKDTPIVFLSMHKSFEQRTESVLRGGNDFITKPFLFMELALKALSFVIRGPYKKPETAKGSNGKDADSVFSRRDLNALKQAILGAMEQE